jgi:GNAT superfamily N-acetyltransferase
MSVTIRVALESDAPAVTAIVNEGSSEPTSVELVRERLEGALTGGDNIIRMVATVADGQVSGYGHVLRDDWMKPGLYYLHIAIAPAVRRQGYGSALFERLHEWAVPRGATAFRSDTNDRLPAGYAFATHLGFRVERRIFESTLDLATFDEAPFTPTLDAARATGIRFLTLADVGDTEETRRVLWELERTVGRDMPGEAEAAILPFETYLERFFDTPGYDPAVQFIAADGATWVGLARGETLETSDGLYNGVTGVLPAWRNRGIALALKLLLIQAAIQRGAPYIRANNDSRNGPMLAVNRKLGYQPEPGYTRMWLQLAE